MSVNLYEPSAKQLKAYADWVASCPLKVRKVARHFKPWKLYHLKTTGHRVLIYSIQEPVSSDAPCTLTVAVLDRYNPGLTFGRRVFGIKPDDLEECDAG